MVRTMSVSALLVLVLSATADAQKNCSKGKPCGNSCIAREKTCRIGVVEKTTPPTKAAVATAIAGGAKWVTDTRGTTYYQVGCSIAKSLPADFVRYFKTEDEAKAANLARSKEKGC